MPKAHPQSAPTVTPAASTDAGERGSFLDPSIGPFFRRVDWGAFWTAFLVTLIAYVATLAPTVTLEDSGELVVGSDYLGVPHPPGYPIWVLITWFFQWVFGWVRYHGQPNPAWSVGLASAVSGALACGLLAMLLSRSGADMLRSIQRTRTVLGLKTESLLCWVGGVTGGLLLAFSPVLWSQSVIAEVYSLNAAFQMIVLLLLYRWMSRPQEDRTLYAMAFLFGLGLTNHQTLMFLGPALVLGVLFRDLKLFRDFFILGLGYLALLFIHMWALREQHPELSWQLGPSSTAFWIYGILALLLPVFSLALPRGRTVCIATLLALLGLSFYLFMPVSSDQNPPINWGYPRTWEGFLHAIGRGQYERITPADIFSAKFVKQIGTYLMDLRQQFTLPVVIAGLLPFCAWGFTYRGRRINAFYVALVLAMAATVLIGLEIVLRLNMAAPQRDPVELLYRVLFVAVLMLAAIGGAIKLVGYVRGLLQQLPDLDFGTGLLIRATLALLGLGIAVLYILVIVHLKNQKLSLFEIEVIVGVLALPPLFLWGIAYLMRSPLELRFDLNDALQQWLLTSVVAFLSLSVFFIFFQNLDMDIQTLFIGRVQFIQSHAIFAIVAGYGLIFALAYLDTVLGGRRWIGYGLAGLVLLYPLVLVYQNYYDEDQIKVIGGAEQNGHDFGWQFGNWQLRGVNGIREDLQRLLPPEEFARVWAEYPDPTFPPEMEPDAIFYGGTDPGRFVPTYMIYCARVRPDVFLITQNALADNTYLNVMRDLYGDAIWISSPRDSSDAFKQYMEDIQAGRIPPGAQVSLEGGRINVQGVQGVMMINGIIARQIFDHNKWRHAFYIEESYAIPWMFPYLTPHGLIMKINAEPLPELPPSVVKQDHDFWDWYTRRLIGTTIELPSSVRRPPDAPHGIYELVEENTNTQTRTWRVGMNPKFRVDVCARKSFSKLRASIAGLYTYRRMYDEAEYAFRQAVALYPLSPEATFRLAADVYLAQRRYDDADRLIESFLRQDPMSTKAAEFLAHIRALKRADARRRDLEQQLAGGAAAPEQALELADLYGRLGQDRMFLSLTMKLLNDPGVKPEVYLQVAQLYAQANRPDLLVVALQHYLARVPNALNIWIDLAAVQITLGNNQDALAAVRRAVEEGGEVARDLARRDPRLGPLKELEAFKALVPPVGLPMMRLPGLPGMF